MVGVKGLEPSTSRSQTARASQLRHTPIVCLVDYNVFLCAFPVVNASLLGYTDTNDMKQSIKNHGAALARNEKLRFGAVGMVNTAVDFIVLNIFAGLFGVPIVLSNIVSTTTAMLVSFTLNKRAVFQGSEKGGVKQLFLFFVVTLTGVWLVQGGVLAAVHHLLGPAGLPEPFILNVAKLAGICVGLIWNYLWYSRVVFKKEKKS